MNKPKIKTLPSIRIDIQTQMNMQSALNKLNESSIVEIKLQEFRRICYEFCSQKILAGETIKLKE